VGFFDGRACHPIHSKGKQMIYTRPITELMKTRFSCRVYCEDPIPPEKQQALKQAFSSIACGPFGSPVRFDLIAAEDQDRNALRGLGTYGYIKGATGFILGAVRSGQKDLEDYAYCLEQIILYATELEIGTCWLGGTFAKSNFARKISVGSDEKMPAVVSIGLIADEALARNAALRQRIGADFRLPWETLFFDEQFNRPLDREKAGAYTLPLDMVRLGPSASNKQPWRVIQSGPAFHFYVQRTKGYRNVWVKMLGVDDMQRVDLGIAMCHFELTARELGLKGRWMLQEPAIEKPDELTEYSVSWVCAD
jgi:nitroreductase